MAVYAYEMQISDDDDNDEDVIVAFNNHKILNNFFKKTEAGRFKGSLRAARLTQSCGSAIVTIPQRI